MGAFGSGHRRPKRGLVEEARGFSATGQEARRLGIVHISKPMPRRGGFRVLGLCPLCARACLSLYLDGEQPLCRKCAGLTYRSSQEQRSPARRVARSGQATIKAGVQALTTWLDKPTDNGKDFEHAMATFEAIGRYEEQTTVEVVNTRDKVLSESERGRVVVEDLNSSTALLRRLEMAIVETPDGASQLPKLINAYVALSNLRDARARTADDLCVGRHEPGPTLEDVLMGLWAKNNPEMAHIVEMANGSAHLENL